jgi:hypothetical protein
MRNLVPFLLTVIALLVIIFLIKPECQNLDPKYCLQDNDCICSENPCFLGNKEYFNKCFLPQQKEIIKACLDACSFGPEEIEFKTICENNQCILASFNRTSGERIG